MAIPRVNTICWLSDWFKNISIEKNQVVLNNNNLLEISFLAPGTLPSLATGNIAMIARQSAFSFGLIFMLRKLKLASVS